MKRVPLDIKEIYRLLCPRCQKKLEALAKDRIAETLAKSLLQGKSK